MDYKDFSESDFETAWLKYNGEFAGSVEWSANEWVAGASIVWSHDRPQSLWNAIVRLSGHNLTYDEIGRLGVGPLETLLNEQYEGFVALAFAKAATSVVLADALNCIYVPDEFDEDFARRLSHLNSNEIKPDN